MFSNNKEEIINIKVDDTERRIIVRALSDLRDKQKLENKHHDFIDTLIIKVCDAAEPVNRREHERY